LKVVTKTDVLVILLVGTALSFGSILLFQGTEATTSLSYDDGIARAAIIDQLDSEIPSEFFQIRATEYLEKGGYEVDLYTSEDITVDFYKNLPSLGYEFIVIRTHALEGRTDNDSPKLYTSEVYSTDKYVNEQLFGIIDGAFLNPRTAVSAIIDVSDLQETNRVEVSLRNSINLIDWDSRITTDEYFVIGAKAVKDFMVGHFPGTTIMLGGCDTMSNTFLADSLLERGASSIIGWDKIVNAHDNDRAMLAVLEETFDNDVEIKQAVESVMDDFYFYYNNTAKLKYYTGQTDSEI